MRNKSKYTNVVFEDIDHSDYPDFCDAHIISADLDGIPMSEEELEVLGENHDLVYELLMDQLF